MSKVNKKLIAQKKQPSLVKVVGKEKANQLLAAVNTSEGWRASMQRNAVAFPHFFKDKYNGILEIGNAYQNLSDKPHIQPEYLNKIIELKTLVKSWIASQLARGKKLKNDPRLQTMLALQEHLDHRQQQVEAHVNAVQKSKFGR